MKARVTWSKKVVFTKHERMRAQPRAALTGIQSCQNYKKSSMVHSRRLVERPCQHTPSLSERNVDIPNHYCMLKGPGKSHIVSTWNWGSVQGWSEILYADGKRFCGELCSRHLSHKPWTSLFSEFNGRGTMTGEKSVYCGEFQNGKRHGQGRATLSNGVILNGKWQNDYLIKGSLQLDHSVYNGEFRSGKRHGQGQEKFSDGTVLSGEWQNGHFIKGSRLLKDGTSYTGEFKDDKLCGEGVFKADHFGTMEGVFHSGVADGCMLHILPSGSWRCAEFKDGQEYQLIASGQRANADPSVLAYGQESLSKETERTQDKGNAW